MKIVITFISAAFLVLVFGGALVLGTNDKVTICHAAGQDGTTHYVELTISINAVYGPGGHFNENGTTQAGHEDDYIGECEDDDDETPSPVVTPSPTPNVTPSPRPTPSSSGGPVPTDQLAPSPVLTLPPTDTK